MTAEASGLSARFIVGRELDDRRAWRPRLAGLLVGLRSWTHDVREDGRIFNRHVEGLVVTDRQFLDEGIRFWEQLWFGQVSTGPCPEVRGCCPFLEQHDLLVALVVQPPCELRVHQPGLLMEDVELPAKQMVELAHVSTRNMGRQDSDDHTRTILGRLAAS